MFRKVFHRFFGSDASDAAVAVMCPPPTRPSCLMFESEEQSDFGTQVAMMMGLQPDSWQVHSSLRRFSHSELGEFVYDENDRLQHCGDLSRTTGSYYAVGRQRALTRGDHVAITEALRFLLLRPMPEQAPPNTAQAATRQASGPGASGLTPAVYAQQAMAAAQQPSIAYEMDRMVAAHQLQKLQNMAAQQAATQLSTIADYAHKLDAARDGGLITDQQAKDCLKVLIDNPTL